MKNGSHTKNIKRKRSWWRGTKCLKPDGHEGYAMYLVRLSWNHPLWAPPPRPKAQFGPLLSTTLINRRKLPSKQRQTTHFDCEAPEAPGAWKGGSNHLLYSPALAPSDYHHFLSMAKAFGDVMLASREACENWLFNQKLHRNTWITYHESHIIDIIPNVYVGETRMRALCDCYAVGCHDDHTLWW